LYRKPSQANNTLPPKLNTFANTLYITHFFTVCFTIILTSTPEILHFKQE